MSLPVIVRPKAQADVLKILFDLEQIRPGLGDQFAMRLRETIDHIIAFPASYGTVWQDVRAARPKKFRYVVYYIVCSDRSEVIAVMHGSRDASAWQSRI